MKTAVHRKEDGYQVTPQSGKFTSMSVLNLGREVGPRTDLTLPVSCQRLGDKSKISKSSFASKNYIPSKFTTVLSDDQNVCCFRKQICPRSQFIIWNVLVCHAKLNQKKDSKLQNSKAFERQIYIQNQNTFVRGTLVSVSLHVMIILILSDSRKKRSLC